MSLIIDGVHKSFSHHGVTQAVLRDIDLEVKAGEFVSLIGHSGCGKSTLLNAIGGLTSPDRGSITLDGEVVRGPGPDRAMVFQNYSLLPRLSLVENVRQAVRASRHDWSKAQADTSTEKYLTGVGLCRPGCSDCSSAISSGRRPSPDGKCRLRLGRDAVSSSQEQGWSSQDMGHWIPT